MPITTGKVPKWTGTHRLAAVALFRALLTQCRNLPLPGPQQESLANIVRNRFRSPRPSRLRLALAFRAGYHALDILDTAASSGPTASSSNTKASDAKASALTRISDLLSRTPSFLQRAPSRPVKPINPAHKPLDEAHKFVNVFPRATVPEGQRRKVPFLVNANGIPMIRHKKPQPESVSRVIKTKILQRQKLWDATMDLEQSWLPLAKWEDKWEESVVPSAFKGKPLGVERSVDAKYADFLRDCQKWLDAEHKKHDKNNWERVRLYTSIIRKERQYKETEDRERKAVAKARWEKGLKLDTELVT